MHKHLTYAKFYLVGALLLLAAGCSSSTSTSDQSSVTMQSQLAATSASRAMVVKGAEPSAINIDSIVITKAIVFVRDVKLHSDKDDSTKDDHDANLKTGPMVLVFDSSGTHVVSTTQIPPANYDRIKFEIHKPDPKDALDSAVLVQYPDFHNGNDYYTVVISGYVYRAGVRTAFTVHSKADKNITIKFKDKDKNDKDKVVLTSGSSSTMTFQFDPRIVFHLLGTVNGVLFDPTDTTHQNDIDNHVLIAIQVIVM